MKIAKDEVGFMGLLFIILLVLKIVLPNNLSWWLVFAPIYAPLIVFILLILIFKISDIYK